MSSYIEHKKARFNFEILEEFNAGLELFGFEVKSIKNNQGKLEGAYIVIRGGEAYLIGAFIPPYQLANTPTDYDPNRARRLLLTKKEIARLARFEEEQGLTIVPISLYNKDSKIKVRLGVARGKKKYDKRETIKKRDTERDLRRTLKE